MMVEVDYPGVILDFKLNSNQTTKKAKIALMVVKSRKDQKKAIMYLLFYDYF